MNENGDKVWEFLQLLNGDIYVYHHGFKEEADIQDVYKFNAEGNKDLFQRFDQSGFTPSKFSAIRLNRAAIAVAWYIDDDSEVIKDLKKIFPDTFPTIETGKNG
jgi:hypothetical protein